MSLPGQLSSSTVAGQIVVVRDRFVEEDGDGRKGNTGCLSNSGLSRARQVIARSTSKVRRKIFRRSSKSRDGGTRNGGGDRFRCVFCVRRPKTVGSPVESVSSDPNDPEFSYEMMRELLQKNEFFSAECSTNFDAAYYMCDHGK